MAFIMTPPRNDCYSLTPATFWTNCKVCLPLFPISAQYDILKKALDCWALAFRHRHLLVYTCVHVPSRLTSSNTSNSSSRRGSRASTVRLKREKEKGKDVDPFAADVCYTGHSIFLASVRYCLCPTLYIFRSQCIGGPVGHDSGTFTGVLGLSELLELPQGLTNLCKRLRYLFFLDMIRVGRGP